MNFLKKLFGVKEATKSVDGNTITGSENNLTDETNPANITKLIFPYFKQFQQSPGGSIPLPDNGNAIDNTKVYSALASGIRLVITPVCADLNCLYILNRENGLEIIQEHQLESWQLTKQELHEIAVQNLRGTLSKYLRTQGDTNGLMLLLDGNLEAGLLLIDELWTQLEEQFGEELVVAVPARDIVYVMGKSNSEMIDQMSVSAKQLLLSCDHPLSENLFIRKKSKWEVFKNFMD
jgi:uncharacterized protein YtpQ (UPF0354 family)